MPATQTHVAVCTHNRQHRLQYRVTALQYRVTASIGVSPTSVIIAPAVPGWL